MKAGELDREITIDKVTLTQSASGEAQETWTKFAGVWAKVTPLSASERFRAEGLHSFRVSVFRIRHLAGLLPTMRIQYEGIVWRITGIAELGRREGYDITAEAVY